MSNAIEIAKNGKRKKIKLDKAEKYTKQNKESNTTKNT